MAFASQLLRHRKLHRLSQLALAMRAKLSQKHVSFLETGRSVPQRTTVLRLAAALELSISARNDLLMAAGFASNMDEDYDAEEFCMVRSITADVLARQSPFPGILVNRKQDVLDVNEGFAALLTYAGKGIDLWAATCRGSTRNMLKLTLSKDGLFPLMSEPGILIPDYLSRVRRSAGQNRPALALLDDVSAWDHIRPYLEISPDRYEPAVTAERYKVGDQQITLISLVASLGTPRSVIAEEMRIELFHPGDKATETLLRSLHMDQKRRIGC